MSEYLTAAGAEWDRDPSAGAWIPPLLDQFGAALGHAVPAGYDAYAVVPIPRDTDPEIDDYDVLDAIIDALREFTGDQPVHTALAPAAPSAATS